MEILGASMVRTAASFLHPGYISAYPRAFEPEIGYPIQYAEPTIQIDVVEALRLEGEAVASSGDFSAPVTTAMAGGGWTHLVFAVACFFGALAVYALVRERYRFRFQPGILAAPLTQPRAGGPLQHRPRAALHRQPVPPADDRWGHDLEMAQSRPGRDHARRNRTGLVPQLGEDVG